MTTIFDITRWKKQKKRFAAITSYDATFSQLFFEQGIQVILVGDSLGMVIQGFDTTLSVTVENISYHTRCVRKGSPNCFLFSDLPFMSYSTLSKAYENSEKLIRSGANMIKIEGGGSWIFETVHNLSVRSIPVCGHLGLTPQSINVIGNYKVQGKNKSCADTLLKHALSLEESGALMLVLECIPAQLAKEISCSLTIPTIGIGAGPFTDGQILVMQDILGITGKNTPSFSKNFMKQSSDIRDAIRTYVKDVEDGIFPDKEHSFYL